MHHVGEVLEKILEELRALRGQQQETAEASRAAARPWLTVEEAAEHARVSVESIRAMIASGRLDRCAPVNGRIVISRAQLDAAIRASASRKTRSGRGIMSPATRAAAAAKAAETRSAKNGGVQG